MARLEVRKLKRVTRLEVGDRAITIGRSSRNDVVLRDERVSREHCIIEMVEGVASLRDLGSRTGTLLNGQKIIAPRPLQHRDRIGIGPFMLVFRDAERQCSIERPTDQDDTRIADEAMKAAEMTHAAQLAELTAAAAAMHSELTDKTERLKHLRTEVESMVQRQRHTEATRQAALDRVERAEQRMAELLRQVAAVESLVQQLVSLQGAVTKTEEAWLAADEAADAASTPEAQQQRLVVSGSLQSLHQQRDAAINRLRDALRAIHPASSGNTANVTPPQAVSPQPSAQRWWKIGVRRNA